MTAECEAKCEVMSELLIQKDPIPSVGPEFYKPFCLFESTGLVPMLHKNDGAVKR